MRLGDHDAPRDEMLGMAQKYAAAHPETVLLYDLGVSATAALGPEGPRTRSMKSPLPISLD